MFGRKSRVGDHFTDATSSASPLLSLRCWMFRCSAHCTLVTTDHPDHDHADRQDHDRRDHQARGFRRSRRGPSGPRSMFSPRPSAIDAGLGPRSMFAADHPVAGPCFATRAVGAAVHVLAARTIRSPVHVIATRAVGAAVHVLTTRTFRFTIAHHSRTTAWAAPGRAEPALRTIEARTVGSLLAIGAEATAMGARIGPWPELRPELRSARAR